MITNGKVLTVMNMKGGVGKTTISAHLSSIIAHHPIHDKVKKVLVIDYDPQFNLSQAFLAPDIYSTTEQQRRNIFAVLSDNPTVNNYFQIQQSDNKTPPKLKDLTTRLFENNDRIFDLVPSTLDLMSIALGKSTEFLTIMECRFETFIQEAKQKYDLIIIDCHPAGSFFTNTALLASDHILIPVTPHKYATRGIGLMTSFINSLSFKNQKPKQHILFNNIPTQDNILEFNLRQNPHFKSKCLDTTMKKYSAYCGLINGQGYIWQIKKAHSRMAYFNMHNIATEVLDRMFP